MNYHHLRYFREVCRTGNLTRAAHNLRVAQSAVSVQIKALEADLGVALFERTGKQLVPTEAGRIALDHAEAIFRTGEELLDLLRHRGAGRRALRIGAVATLSRNFQIGFLRRALRDPGLELVVRSGSLRDLLLQLKAHTLDLVLSTTAVPRDADTPWHSHRVDEQEVCIVGHPDRRAPRLRFPSGLHGLRMVLPGAESSLRTSFDAILDRAGVRPVIVAEVDDMAMLRLFARESDALTLLPRVVVADELKSRTLVERCRVPGVTETFYAITTGRRYPNPAVRALLT